MNFDARAYTGELDETSKPVDRTVPDLGRDEPMFEKYNNESPVDVYKSMAGGTIKTNHMSYVLQESEQEMKSNVAYFKGSGFNLGEELPYIELVGPKETFNNAFSIETTMNVSANYKVQKLTSEKKIEPYTSLCNENEKTGACLKRVFSCDPDRPWKECDDQLITCPDDPLKICKYRVVNNDVDLIKRYNLGANYETEQECKDSPWSDCGINLKECGDGYMCKYKINRELIKAYDNPKTGLTKEEAVQYNRFG